MKLLTVCILLISLFQTDPRKITKINRLKKEAEKSFQSGDFQNAIAKYLYLKDSMLVQDDNILLNIAHAKYQLQDSSAQQYYQSLASSENKKIQSIALQQLGVINKLQNNLEKAAEYLKKSIKSDPTNKASWFNYEVVKKLLNHQKKNKQNKQDKNQNKQKQEQKNKEKQGKDSNKSGEKQEQKNKEKQGKDSNKPGEKQEQKNKEKQGKDSNKPGEKQEQKNKEKQGKDSNKSGEKQEQKNKEKQGKDSNKPGEKQEQKNKEKQGENSNKPGEKQEQKNKEKQGKNPNKSGEKQGTDKHQMNEKIIGISEQKAKAILEAMRQNEIKYLQNKRRKPTKRPPKGRPDW